ncbi:MAG TPA: hypothetical protein VHR15_19045 [Ktedonobacterales bacterium]|jgi:hypothetical protein|nr:hypothetical protein [Ktedonobacterales bacterium]
MPQDQSGSDEPTPQRSSGFLEDQQTRRLFLKAAVISGAAVAAVGAAGAAAASASPQILRQLRGQPATVSGQLPATMCFESSGFDEITEFTVNDSGKTNPGTFFVWFTVQHLPAGTWTYTLTPDPGAGTPFEYNDPGNNVYVFPLADGTATDRCPSGDPDAHPPADQVGHSIGDVFPFTTGSLGDFRVRVHIDFTGPIPPASGTIYTFVGTLTNGSITYTGQVSVTAFPK